jgi:hypothetical protein
MRSPIPSKGKPEQIPAIDTGEQADVDRAPLTVAPGTLPTGKPAFALTLEAVPSWNGPPAIIRLRRFLKAALRSYGLKCTECREAPAKPAAPSGRNIDRRPVAGAVCSGEAATVPEPTGSP